MKKKVLIFAGYYIPSVKGGGPIQSIKNLVDNLSDTIDFYIIAADRDLGDKKPFGEIKLDKWTKVGRAQVFYTNPNTLTWRKTRNIITNISYDVIYLNSFFSYKSSIIPILLRKFKLIPSKPIVLAPRGQFSPGALGLKNKKKNIFLNLIKILGIYKNIIWHATAETEKKDIEINLGKNCNIIVANNLTANYKELNFNKDIYKEISELKVVFISRIHAKKNLKKAIKLLKNIKGNIEFNIYGPVEDENYWSECKKEIEELPFNIKAKYKGLLEHENVIKTFKSHHIFLFPTLGENFGHIISEALIGGCPVIISNQTPWNDLEEKKVGWDLQLNDEENFVKAIQYCVNLDNNEYQEMSKKAFEYGKNISNKANDISNTYKLFYLEEI